MTEKTKENWITTKVRRTLSLEIEKILQTDQAKKEGLTNTAQFVDSAIRELLEKIEGNSDRKQQNIQLEKKVDDILDIIKNQNIQQKNQLDISHITEKSTNSNFRSVVVKDDHIRIFDDGLRNGTPVKVIFDDKKLYCDECQSYNCNHVKHVWSIDHIAGQLEERGFSIVERTCPKCGTVADKNEIENVFGYRKSNGKTITQSWCRYCRTQERKDKRKAPRIDKYF